MNIKSHSFNVSGTPKVFPLSPIQVGLIYESVLADRPWINLEQIICHFDREIVDLDVMAQAWQAVTDRHDILRSSVHWEGLDHPEQRIADTVTVAIETQDISALRGTAQTRRFETLVEEDRNAGFDLTQSRSWRLTWIKLGKDRSALMFTFHHVLLDGYSFTTLPAEAFQRYDALQSGNIIEDLPTPVPFFNHVNALATADFSASQEFYTDMLRGFETPNKIALDTPRETSCGRKAIIDQIMPTEFGEALATRAKAGGATVATMVLSAWGLVTSRSSGQTDAVFGVTRAGRHVVPYAELIHGCLINTISVRTKTAPDMTVDEYLLNLRNQQVAMRPHEAASLVDIAGWSEVSASQSLFETSVMFDRSSIHHTMSRLGAVTDTRRFEVLEEGALPLTLAVYQDAQMFFRLEYDTERYSKDTAMRLLSYVLTLLTQFVELPGDTALHDVQMLPETELSDLAILSNPQGPGTYPECDTDLAGQFGRQAALRQMLPAISVMGSPEQITYAKLNRRANQLAHHLLDKGVKSGDLVGLFLPRSTDFVIAMLATIKIGAAFVPLDPAYPKTSIDHMLSDSGAIAVLTDTAHQDAITQSNIIRVDDHETTAQCCGTRPDVAAPRPDKAAYVIYTSGSSGRPKGVVITHRALAQHIQSIQSAFALERSDQVLQFASLSFDVSIEEILPTLLAGAELVLRDHSTVESMSSFLESVDEFSLTVLNLPTAFWTALVEHMTTTQAKLPQSVRLVVVGGEAVSRTVLDKFVALAPGIKCLNGYGPTEVTITSTLYDTKDLASLAETDDVPIGRPLPHISAYICATDGSLSPRGTAGELVLAGPSVSKGYLNRADLTAKQFLTAPLSDGDIAYRTGDLAVWRPDGNIVYKGREDRQVKINGFRVELHEVERATEACAGIAKSVVAIDGKGTAQARLIAWVQPTSDPDDLQEETLNAELASRLPEHMRPTVVVVDSFPITPGGKIDNASLPRPNANIQTSKNFDTGNTNIETLRTIFARLLNVRSVAHDTSFYDLGGNSLLAVRLIGQIEQEFGQRIALSTLRENPTPIGIAKALNQDITITTRDYVVPIQPYGDLPPIYGVHVLGQNECFFRPLAKRLGPNQPVFGLSVGILTPESPTGVEDTAQAYFEEVQRHRPEGPICLTAVSQGSFIAYELAQLLTKAGRDVAMLALFDAAGPAGRPSLKGAERFKTHMELLRRTGPEYLGQIASNRINNMRNTFEKSRVRRAQKTGGNGLKSQSVEAFVAANSVAIEDYNAAPYPKKLTVFRAKASQFDSEEAIRNGLGWKPVAKGGLDLIEVPGGHISMLESPHVDVLAEQLTDAIAKAVEE